MKRIFISILLVCILASCASALDFDDLAEFAEPGERVRLGIMKFTSKTYGVPDSMAAGISDFFGRMLFKADGIMLVERERLDDIAQELRLGMSGLVDPKTAAKIGKLAGADYILLGSITNLGHAASGAALPSFGVPFFGGLGVNTEKVKADLDIRVVKVETGEIVHAEAASGTASKSDTDLYVHGVSLRDSEFGGIEGTAILNATAKLAPGIQKALTGRDTLTSILASELKKNTKKAAKSSKTETKNTSTRPKKKKKADPVPEVNDEPATVSASATDMPVTSEPDPEPEEANNFENYSTDPAEVIPTYDLPAGEKNMLRIKHLNLRQYGKRKKAYDEFTELYEEFNGDYLAAYKAGEIAQALGSSEDAEFWYSKALEVNPNYKPAIKALKKLRGTSKRRR